MPQNEANGYINMAVQLQHWSYNGLSQLVNARNANNPNGLSITNWTVLAAHFPANDAATVAQFARINGWVMLAINALATAFATAPNNLTAANWTALAALCPVNAAATTQAFAQIPNWNWAGIHALCQAFNNPPGNGGLTGPQWVTIAGHVGNNNHAEAALFARIAGWGAAEKIALAGHFGANNYGETAARWTQLALRRPNNPAYIREMMHYVGNGWPDQIAFNGGNASLFLVGDGIGWGNGNPHVTIHGLTEDTGPGAWHGHPEYHVRLAGGSANVYDFVRDADAFFNNVNPGGIAQARVLAAQFRAAMGL